MLQRLASMELSFEDGETVYVGHVDDVDVTLDITLDDNNNVQQLNLLVVRTPQNNRALIALSLRLKS